LGRLELLGAGVMGRRAPLAAAVLVAAGAVALTCAVTAAGLVAVGQDASGSVALGLAWAGVGLTFVGVSAVAAQLAQTARGAGGITLAVLGAAYLLRAVGDTTEGPLGAALVWLSPLGWPEKVSIYGENRYIAAIVPLAVTAGLLALADRLLARRDLGSGLLATRVGPGRAAAALRSPAGLAWRLQRGSLIGWTVGYALLGLVLGAISQSITSMLDNPDIVEMLRAMGGNAGTLVDLFVRTELVIAAIAAAGYGISAALRLRSEETTGNAEPVLAGAVSRPRWLSSHLVVALSGSAWLMVVLAVTVALGARGGLTGPGTSVASMLGAAAVAVPAVWVCVGLAAFVYGTVPRWVTALWAALVVFLVLGEFGRTLKLPDSLINVSPFPHIPPLPGGALTLTPVVALSAVAATLGLVGYAAFRRRDIG
ncbi:MAG TPA: hypothetical protein VHM65_04030, partial [Candidatus Lustribacter sp.]|nr:hypothetical protein [Candidatus Lustribacter sp.]